MIHLQARLDPYHPNEAAKPLELVLLVPRRGVTLVVVHEVQQVALEVDHLLAQQEKPDFVGAHRHHQQAAPVPVNLGRQSERTTDLLVPLV